MPVAVQRSFGPSAGHAFNRPVSVEILSRFGPRNCGQGASAAALRTSAVADFAGVRGPAAVALGLGVEGTTGAEADGALERKLTRSAFVSSVNTVAKRPG